MSANVTIEVIKGYRCMPWGSYYLGGNGTRDFFLREIDTWEMDSNGSYIREIGILSAVALVQKGIREDVFYVGHTAESFLEDYRTEIERIGPYKFWVVIG